MPIQAPQWTEFLSCPICCNQFDNLARSPISLGCSHTICKHCLANLHRKQCPFDQVIHILHDSSNYPYPLVDIIACLLIATCFASNVHTSCYKYSLNMKLVRFETFFHFCFLSWGASKSILSKVKKLFLYLYEDRLMC